MNLQTVRIDFDGGNGNNDPKNYGVGYGSYRLSGEGWSHRVERVSHGVPMSNNAAEILTLVSAIHHLRTRMTREFLGYETRLHIVGDSQIALKWARRGGKKKLSKGSSELFQKAIKQLDQALEPFAEIVCEWKGREHAVALFGH